MILYKRLLILLFIGIATNTFAQITTNEKPISFSHSTLKKVESIELMPTKMLMSEQEKKNNPLQFAWLIETQISPSKQGKWQSVDKGRIWQLKIKSPGAYSLNFLLENTQIPKGAKLFFYSADKKFTVGAITYKNNKKSKKLPIQAIPGDEVYVEYYLPEKYEFNNDFTITKIGYDYKNAFGNQGSEPCEVNINCAEGNDWQTEKRAVAKLLIDNQYYCSGTLINSTRYDGTPYFITAEHCVHYESEAENTIFYFNYESADCDGFRTDTIQTVAGATVIATGKNRNLDFSLLELSTAPPEEYNPYYVGWNRSATPPSNVTCIHHPNGDIKRISKDYDETIIGDFGGGYDSYSHWQILRWDLGATEGGSSGSALFNSMHQLVGTLTGGQANCTNPINDYFSRIDRAWADYSEDFYQLKNWLDPQNTGVEYIDGYDPYTIKNKLDLSAFSINNIPTISCSNTFKPSIKLKNRGLDTIVNFDFKIMLNDKSNSYSIDDTILPGNYYDLNIDSTVLDYNDYSYQFIIEKVNGKKDEVAQNDTLKTNFSLKDWNNITLNVLTDEYASETTWELSNTKDSILYQNTSMQDTTLYTRGLCLDYGCYALKFADAGGDGICCDYGKGHFLLLNPQNNDTLVSGGNFTDSINNPFCIQPPKSTHKYTIPYILYPNPITNEFTLEVFEKTEFQITIYNSNATLIYQKSNILGQITLDVSSWNQGIYFLQIRTNGKLQNTKFIVY